MRKELEMSKNKELEQAVASVSVESLLSVFGVKRISNAKDEGLLSFNNVKNKLGELVDYNIEQFKNNSWNTANMMLKMLTYRKKEKVDIFSLRIMGKYIYRCSCNLPTNEKKIEFLQSIKALLETGSLDKEITDFCEQEVLKKKEQKKAAAARRRKRKAEEKEQKAKGKMVEAKLQEINENKAAQVSNSGEETTQTA